jgi:hypothetical protein
MEKVHIQKTAWQTLCGKNVKRVLCGTVDSSNVNAKWVCRSCAASYLSDRR